MVSFAAPGGSVGAHVDQYDVFLLQGLGRRRWQIDARPTPDTRFRDDVELKLLRHFHPSHDWVLEPGDMLYLPPGVPHHGVALDACLTFSVGMRAPARSELLLDFAEFLAEAMPESERYADPDLIPARGDGEIDAAALQRVARALAPFVAPDAATLRRSFGRFITCYRSAGEGRRAAARARCRAGRGPPRSRGAVAPASVRALCLGARRQGGRTVRRRRAARVFRRRGTDAVQQ
jgi:50S ribosomal protein L16 3-hydroxylase